MIQESRKIGSYGKRKKDKDALTFAAGLTILEMVLKMELSMDLSDCCGVRFSDLCSASSPLLQGVSTYGSLTRLFPSKRDLGESKVSSSI